MLSEKERTSIGPGAAWEQFTKTGKVGDYITYLSCKNQENMEQETPADADKNPWNGTQTTEYRGK